MAQAARLDRTNTEGDDLVDRHLAIMVLMGGPSVERSVSLASGEAVAAALESRGHRVIRADVRPEDLSALDRADVDVVFVALHGSFGEDGQLQHILEQRGLRYTGSDPRASRLGMDKIEAKRRFAEAGVPTPPFAVAKAGRRAVLDFPFPVVVKPADQGSSVDCSIVREASELDQAVTHVVDTYGRCLIERYIRGPELTVGILAGRALPVCQIRSATTFYDYQAKYQDDRTEYLFDIDLPGELLQRVQRLSVRAFEALGCRDMSRVDWMIDAATCQPYCLEANTIPGFTSHSLLPKAAARAGISFADLCEQLPFTGHGSVDPTGPRGDDVRGFAALPFGHDGLTGFERSPFELPTGLQEILYFGLELGDGLIALFRFFGESFQSNGAQSGRQITFHADLRR